MTRRTLAGRFILTTEQHPHGTHLKIRSTKSSQMLVVVEEEIEPLAQAMLNLYLGWKVTAVPRWRVDSHVSATIPGVNTRTWTATAYRPTGYISESRLFGTWREAYDYADAQARKDTP